jgi:hypothetical protein
MRAGERDTVDALVERLVARAQIPGRARRDDLRRELLAHFDDAGETSESIDQALRRFGPEADVGERLRRVYRLDCLLFHLARIAAALVLSLTAAILVQIAANIRVDPQAAVWSLAPGFSRAAGVSAALVIGFVTAAEMTRRPFRVATATFAIGSCVAVGVAVRLLLDAGLSALTTPALLVVVGWSCSRCGSRAGRTLLLFAAFAAAIDASHLVVGVHLAASRAMLSGAALVAVWASTAGIFSRFDHLLESDAPRR